MEPVAIPTIQNALRKIVRRILKGHIRWSASYKPESSFVLVCTRLCHVEDSVDLLHQAQELESHSLPAFHRTTRTYHQAASRPHPLFGDKQLLFADIDFPAAGQP